MKDQKTKENLFKFVIQSGDLYTVHNGSIPEILLKSRTINNNNDKNYDNDNNVE